MNSQYFAAAKLILSTMLVHRAYVELRASVDYSFAEMDKALFSFHYSPFSLLGFLDTLSLSFSRSHRQTP
ncbi:hypothetical protein VNO77_23970 [Canavalia gladiata]|uniref:Uncharacterized protein n=1 Tax=Canavalia gladiata TaxID=3824 RepID=A0AAN9L673_CANGL